MNGLSHSNEIWKINKIIKKFTDSFTFLSYGFKNAVVETEPGRRLTTIAIPYL